MHIKTISPNKYFLRLDKGELVNTSLTAFFEEQKFTFGYLTAIGALEDPTISYYDLEAKEYIWKDFTGTFEVDSLIGNIALVEGKPFLHAHVVLSDHELKTFGGHLKVGKVGGTLEVLVEKFNEVISRKLDSGTGLKVLDLD